MSFFFLSKTLHFLHSYLNQSYMHACISQGTSALSAGARTRLSLMGTEQGWQQHRAVSKANLELRAALMEQVKFRCA